jgi:pyrroline-5-carboxylate reductase
MTQRHVGFIGTGRIAQALMAGLAGNAGTVIAGYDKDPATISLVSERFAVQPKPSIPELARDSEVLVIAVKPYQVADVLAELTSVLTPGHLLVSVAAGISTEFISLHTPSGMRIVRVMPNTPAFVGEGMTALCKGGSATVKDLATAKDIFSSVGKVAIVEESAMDAATALSGSGPAYMFRILASLAEGGEACGLRHDDALLLAAQTMLGAAVMVLKSEKSPEELISEVTTPGGTTEAGLRQMELHRLREALIDTVRAAAARSRELMK